MKKLSACIIALMLLASPLKAQQLDLSGSQNPPAQQQSVYYTALMLYYANHGLIYFPRMVDGNTYQLINLVNGRVAWSGNLQTISVPAPTPAAGNGSPVLGQGNTTTQTLGNSLSAKYQAKVTQLFNQAYPNVKSTQAYNQLCTQATNRLVGLLSGQQGATAQQLASTFNGNTVMLGLLDGPAESPAITEAFNATAVAQHHGTLIPLSFAKSGTASLGGSAATVPTALVNGVADFLIERTNQELEQAVLAKLQAKLEGIPALQTLFPQTLQYISAISSTALSTNLNNLKVAFHTDLSNMLSHFGQLATLEQVEALMKQHWEFALVFVVVDMYVVVKEGKHIAQGLENLLSQNYFTQLVSTMLGQTSTPMPNVLNSLQTAAFASTALRDVVSTDANKGLQGYISAQQVQATAPQTAQGQDQFLSIFENVAKTVVNSTPVGQAVNWLDNKIENSGFVKDIEGLIEIAQMLEVLETDMQNLAQAYKTAKTNGQSVLSVAVVNQLNTTVADAFAVGFEVGTLLGWQQNTMDKLQRIDSTYNAVAQTVSNTYQHIETQEYGAAVFDVLHLLQAFLPADVTNNKTYTTVTSGVFNAGQLIASLANADSAAQVTDILRQTALPVGGSQMKKEGRFNLAVQSYVGYYYTWQALPGTPVGNLEGGIGINQGLTAPIGITGSFGFNLFKSRASISLGANVVDLGAVVSSRITQDTAANTTTTSATIDWNQLFAPGYQVVLGLPAHLPLSIGFKRQWNYFTTTANPTAALKPRNHLFIAVDIPLYNLVNTNRQNVRGR